MAFLSMTLTMFVLRGNVASKLFKHSVSRWLWLCMAGNVKTCVGVPHHGENNVLIAYGENLDHSGKLNSVTLTGRMVSPTYARSFQTPQGATLLLDAVCAVMQATCAILDSSMCAPRRTCKWFLFGAILTHQNTLQCVRGWA